MEATLQLDIVTPQGQIFSNPVKSVTLPGEEGEFGVLPGHVGVISTLRAGVIEFTKTNGETEMVAVNWGYVKVDESGVDVLADGAVAIAGKSESEIAKTMEQARKLLEEATDNRVAISSVVSKIENRVKSSL